MRYISYLRVSTDKQGKSGLGLDAQRKIVLDFLAGALCDHEYVEVESGKNANRSQLALALAHAKRIGGTLLIAKLDRLARKVSFIANLMDSGVAFIACDMPHAKPFELHIRASLAEEEARMIGERTRLALAAAKARGVVLGGYRGVSPDPNTGLQARQKAAEAFALSVGGLVAELSLKGLSLRGVAAELDARGVRTPRGGAWSVFAVKAVMAKVG